MSHNEPALVIPSAHHGRIHSLTYNSWGSYLFSGGADRLIHLWNGKTGNRIQSYKVHGYEVLDLEIVQNDTKFASCGGDRSVYLWDVESGKTVARFSGHSSKVHTVSFHDPEGMVLASGGLDKLVNLWDVRAFNSYKPIQVLREAKDGISSVQMLEHEIITGSTDGHVRIYDVRMGKLSTLSMGLPVTSVRKRKPMSSSSSSSSSLAAAASSSSVLVSTLDSKLKLIDCVQGTTVREYTDPGYINKELRIKSRFTANGALVASVSESDGQMVLWNRETASVDHHIAGCTSYSYAFHPYSSSAVATTSLEGDISVHSITVASS